MIIIIIINSRAYSYSTVPMVRNNVPLAGSIRAVVDYYCMIVLIV